MYVFLPNQYSFTKSFSSWDSPRNSWQAAKWKSGEEDQPNDQVGTEAGVRWYLGAEKIERKKSEISSWAGGGIEVFGKKDDIWGQKKWEKKSEISGWLVGWGAGGRNFWAKKLALRLALDDIWEQKKLEKGLKYQGGGRGVIEIFGQKNWHWGWR